MQEYKREKSSLETRLKDMSKATAHHNDHLRAIDAWYNQVSRLPVTPLREIEYISDSSKVD